MNHKTSHNHDIFCGVVQALSEKAVEEKDSLSFLNTFVDTIVRRFLIKPTRTASVLLSVMTIAFLVIAYRQSNCIVHLCQPLSKRMLNLQTLNWKCCYPALRKGFGTNLSLS